MDENAEFLTKRPLKVKQIAQLPLQADCASANRNEKIISWIIKRAEEEYADDVDMVLAYGSSINGTAHEKSDVDCYFIPRTERGYGFGTDFILEGVGYDIFPMSWERVENIADMNEVLLPCVGDVRILYARTEEEEKRFAGFGERHERRMTSVWFGNKQERGPSSEPKLRDEAVVGLARRKARERFTRGRHGERFEAVAFCKRCSRSRRERIHCAVVRTHENEARFGRDALEEAVRVARRSRAQFSCCVIGNRVGGSPVVFGFGNANALKAVGKDVGFAEHERVGFEVARDVLFVRMHHGDVESTRHLLADFCHRLERFERSRESRLFIGIVTRRRFERLLGRYGYRRLGYFRPTVFGRLAVIKEGPLGVDPDVGEPPVGRLAGNAARGSLRGGLPSWEHRARCAPGIFFGVCGERKAQ